MSKKGKKNHITEHGRGEIKHDYLAALVTSKVFKTQVVNAKKGKGSFSRKAKHQGQEPYLIAI
ncbi:alternative ribosome rescue factor ArfA [Thalassotalea sp. 1_MG-2023]|uniref:alternative ribosome rescue factor ArfA n=1 Tax=Thalassotalea sp. 1_MG-2023 TaxID=3062680 RepID=UPI0026E1EE10|nr:alternative ribosome rescue factor ArfA [Thalassotalea sp. 1_MG-2023]MDO6425948.1 alternative ribosome rescue factor ArfA [Thalassotalea sp. 1_MG-2023]